LVGYNTDMRGKCVAVVVLVAASLAAQTTLSFPQLRDLIESSVKQKVPDKQLAKYLKNQKLGFALDERLIEEFIGIGVGPRTLNMLRQMAAESTGLPKPQIASKAARGPKQPPPPSPEEQERIIETARENALTYTDRLPDFVCLQLTRRYVDPSGLEMDWLKQDEIKTRVSYVDDQENYEVLSVNNRMVNNKGMFELGGANSTGEFGSMLSELFEPKTGARFRWARHSLLRGRHVYVFHYQVLRARSRWRIRFENDQEIVTAYRGLVYIDKESEQVLRIAMSATGIPSEFPIQEARSRLDYDFAEISGRQFLLPLKAQMNMRQSKFLVRNNVEFRLYRKFSAESTLTFEEIDDLEPLPIEDTAEQP
jgi:hypothetical protein